MKGTWDENSDYDVVIIDRPSAEKMDSIRKHKYNAPIDIQFSSSERAIEAKNVEIP